MSRLRMAVIGAGALGRHHARILSGFEHVELVAVCDPRESAGTAVAGNCGARWLADYRDALDGIDACTIAVPTVLHHSIAMDVLGRGLPVLVEKPLTARLDEAEELVELAEARGLTLAVGHVERFNPAMQAARPLCAGAKYIRAERLSNYAFRSTDIGAVHDLMIHDLDLVLSLVESPVARVEAFGVSILGGHEDAVQARIVFENGAIADLTANRVCPAAKRSLHVWAPDGVVTVDLSSREVVRYRPSETLLYGTPPLERAAQPGADLEQLKAAVFGTFIDVTRPAVPPGDALTAELADFVECIPTGRAPVVDGRAALKALRVADEVLSSAHHHQWDGHVLGAVGPFVRAPQLRRKAG
ncbi:MAG TPA: Gfo/Idh/MocA family oxidoreductase [Planctomycetaceae bacterium]|nr:Gfo/Idh/MocA family oxidoreductase [Planctomycetaceae bacterium]